MKEMPPGYPSRRRLISIGAVLAVTATIAGLLAPERDERGAPAPTPTPTPSAETQPDRPGP